MSQKNHSALMQWVIVTLTLLIGLWNGPLALFEHDWNMIPGDWGDARFNNYILEHGYRYISGQTPSFWDAPFMYPFKNVIAFSDNLLGTMPFYALFRAIGIDRESSLQCWILLIYLLNFLSAFLVLQRWKKNLALSLAGAWIFAFGIFLTGQMNHLQVFPRFMVPPVLYASWLFLKDGKNRHLIILLLGLVYQFYCAIYLGFILLYCQLCLLLAYWAVYGKPEGIRKIGQWLTGCFLATVMLLPLMWPYVKISKITGMRSFESLQNTLPRPVSYFFTHPAATTWKGILSEHSQYAFEEWWSHFMFMGAVIWIGILPSIVFLFQKNRPQKEIREVRFFLLFLALCLLFTLRLGDFSLYKFVHQLPGFSSMRSVDRYINAVSFVFVLVMVVGLSTLFQRYRAGKQLAYLVLLLAIVDNRTEPWELKRFYKQEARQEIAEVKTIIQQHYDGRSKAIALMFSNVNMDLPSYHDKLIRTHLSVMLAAQEMGIPVVNAYTGHYPPGYMDFFDYRNEDALESWIKVSGVESSDIQRIAAPIGNMNQ